MGAVCAGPEGEIIFKAAAVTGRNADQIGQQENKKHIGQKTQEDLAEKIGVSRQTLSKYETGESLPDIEKCTMMD